MPRALEVARDGYDEMELDLAGRPADIGEHIRVFKVTEARV